ncbi:MAG: hypothetical protein IJT91_00715 [Clostridia bacterium]|nr:hypothetical protein [Clostridia bacterium]
MLNKYGYFSESGDEFIITTPDIERNWYNYLFTDNYITFTSQAGIGEGIIQDRLGNRISPVLGRGLYAVCGGEGWCLNGLPVYDEDKKYLCRHGIGYTVIELEKNGIRTEYGLFVPNEDLPTTGCEVAWVKVKNLTDSHKSVKIMAYCANDLDGRYYYQGYNVSSVEYLEDINGIYYGVDSGEWNGGFAHFESFISCGQPVSGYDCARSAFIGPYGNIHDPKAIHKGGCSNSECIAEKGAFALQTTHWLGPGEEGFSSFVMGITESFDRIKELTARFDTEEKVFAEVKAVKDKYYGIFGETSISTPDKNLDKLVNNWLKYQTVMGSRWARVRHNGIRDLTSDTDCLSSFAPELAWERLKRIMTFQYSNGYAPRTVENGAIRDNGFSDNTVWMNFAAHCIICELGEPDKYLSEEVPFNDGSTAPVYEHLRRSVDWLYNFKGLHGLIQIWEGDWNDCINRAGREHKGVSVWLTVAWYRANKLFAELAGMIGDEEQVRLAEERGEEMKKLVDEYGWDEEGGYYIYAINDAGRRIGASSEAEGSLHLAPQIWAVLSGIGVDGKDVKALTNAEKILDCDLGTRIMYPPYTHYDRGVGAIGVKHPGVHENGSVYLHSMCWKLAVDALLGREDKVEWDIERILPFANPVVAGRAEPYILSNSYMGEETGYRYGTPGQSWRTASGQWFLKAMFNFVFGIIPTLNGLKLAPCLPSSWSEAEAVKRFRKGVYHIKYKRTGNKKITLNGKPVEGDTLPVIEGEAEVVCEF